MNNNMEILGDIFSLFIGTIMLSFALIYRKYKPLDGKQGEGFMKGYDVISKFIIFVSIIVMVLCQEKGQVKFERF